MGLYIKGMEMPKNCFDCQLFDDVYTDADGDDDYICALGVPLDYYQVSGKTKKDCPLIPVPKHGDLIDRDALPTGRVEWEDIVNAPTIIEADEANTDSFIRIFEEDDEEDGMDSFIRILKD